MPGIPDLPPTENGNNETYTGAGEAVIGDGDNGRVVADLVSRQVLDARDGADLQALTVLEAKIAKAVQSSRSPATLKAYRTDWADFTLWCETHGLSPMPAMPATISAYLADLAEPADDRAPLAASTNSGSPTSELASPPVVVRQVASSPAVKENRL